MRTVVFHENSLDDFQSGLDYYDDISLSLADRFEITFWETIERIKLNPYHFQLKYSEIRVAILPNFPFAVHFLVGNDVIDVIRILHTKREY